jgi:hypothetical protein
MNMHKIALERIANNPDKIGIKEKVVGVSIEKRLFDIKKGVRYQTAEPDVIFELSNGKVIIIEYKNNGGGIDTAQKQLAKATYWYGKYSKVPSSDITTLIIDGDKYPFLKK